MTELRLAVGAATRRFRRLRGFNQVQLAKRAGVSQGQISRFEHAEENDRVMAMRTLVAVANALGVPPWVLLLPLPAPYDELEYVPDGHITK